MTSAPKLPKHRKLVTTASPIELSDFVRVRKVQLNSINVAFGRVFTRPPVDHHWWRCKDIHGCFVYILAENYGDACAFIERKFPLCYTRLSKEDEKFARIDPSRLDIVR